ncbi:SCO6745 family protein [Pseudonocardia sp. CA-107938]|uniref:SCO6745 family protein n=1 Tax=Pseudonocardia sp. CA-107938 TaxID=3240021 RepID=UPI003D943A72
MWRALEPIHAVTYFEPEPLQYCTALGTKGFWMSYFAQRAAPLGAVGPDVVGALFYGFAPGRVARAVPDAWAVASPERFVAARLAAVDVALRRLLGADVIASGGLAEAAEIATAAAAAAPTAGRALAAANAALPVPEEPHLALWHAQTVLREQRGDGHVAALLTAGIDPVESLVLVAAAAPAERAAVRDPANWRTWRGWTEEEWVAGAVRLAGRGLVEPGGAAVTAAGAQLRREIEARTDELASPPWDAVGEAAAERLLELALPLRTAVLAGAFPAVDPIGLAGDG